MNYLFLLLLFICSCSARPNLEKEKQAILDLQSKQRQYHFQKNTKDFIAQHSENFISIDGGTVHKPSRESSFQMFDAYFKSVKFIRWDDQRPPEIRFSDDASVAYVAVEKLVELEASNAAGKNVTDTTHYAWISVYRKIKGIWKLDAIASTDK